MWKLVVKREDVKREMEHVCDASRVPSNVKTKTRRGKTTSRFTSSRFTHSIPLTDQFHRTRMSYAL